MRLVSGIDGLYNFHNINDSQSLTYFFFFFSFCTGARALSQPSALMLWAEGCGRSAYKNLTYQNAKYFAE